MTSARPGDSVETNHATRGELERLKIFSGSSDSVAFSFGIAPRCTLERAESMFRQRGTTVPVHVYVWRAPGRGASLAVRVSVFVRLVFAFNKTKIFCKPTCLAPLLIPQYK
jgi:hypothetical protein